MNRWGNWLPSSEAGASAALSGTALVAPPLSMLLLGALATSAVMTDA